MFGWGAIRVLAKLHHEAEAGMKACSAARTSSAVYDITSNHKDITMKDNDNIKHSEAFSPSLITDNKVGYDPSERTSPPVGSRTSGEKGIPNRDTLLASLGIDSGSFLAAAECENVANTIRNRGATHGDAFENLQDIADRWSHYINKMLDGEGKINLNVGDVAYMMVEMKLSRSLYGDASEVDHSQDIMGYSAIWSSFLRLAKEGTTKARK